jgi:N-acetylmuramoyl-L-alanine amidase
METWFYPGSIKGQEAAVSILEEVKATFPDHRDRGSKEGNLAVLRETKMPAVLVECEFITNPNQLLFLDHLENQMGLAEEISEGIDALPW